MCGLSAIINFRNGAGRHRADLGALRRMTDLVAHRGPDGEGFVTLSETGESQASYFAGLGHRRLAIVELSDLGHQPMSAGDGRYWMVYNGEIYNHVELADELLNNGVKLKSRSDTEVLLNAFRLWGPDCLARLNGMFSFVIVDFAKHRVFAARDRFGIKPLYYWVNPNGFLAFASEIKQFTGLPGWRAKLNRQRAYDFLAWGATDHKDETMFDGIMQLTPGQAVDLPFGAFSNSKNFTNGRLPAYNWYELNAVDFDGSYTEAAARFRDLFDASVQRRLRSDVPVGACLSGGLDSSSIVSLAAQKLDEGDGEPVATFSACSDNEELDERKWIDIVQAHTSSRAHYVYPDADQLLDVLPRLTWHQDEPFATTSIFAQWKVFEMVGESSVKVMLDGQGADEQLAGYDIYFGIKLAGLLAQLKLGALSTEFRAIQGQRGYPSSTLLMYMANCALPAALVDPLRNLGQRTSLTPDWLNLQALEASAAYPFYADSGRGTSIQKANYNQIKRTGLQKLLRFEDRNSMAFSVEARVPFLDHHLVEFVLGLPDEYKLEAGVTKRILRDAMTGILPDKIRSRSDKIGFQTAEQHWMCGAQREKFSALINDAVDRSGGILNHRATKRCAEILSGDQPYSNLPWKIISFGVWMDEFNVSV